MLEWIQFITAGGVISGSPGKHAESFADFVNGRRTIRARG